MNSSLNEVLEGYSDDQIDLIVSFLRRCTQARQSAVDCSQPCIRNDVT